MNPIKANIVMPRSIGVPEYVEFLYDQRPTGSGAYYSQIHRYTPLQMESDHQYIQWLFPLTEASMFADSVPILNLTELIEAIRKDTQIKGKCFASYRLLMNHWGFSVNFKVVNDHGNGRHTAVLMVNNPERLKLLNGHNALRFCRMLQSLVYHGCEDLAKSTFNQVMTLIVPNGVIRPAMTDDGKMTLWEFYLRKSVDDYHTAQTHC